MSTSTVVTLTPGAWVEVAAASGSNVIATVDLFGARDVRFAADDAIASIPAGFPGLRILDDTNRIDSVLIEDGEKLFARSEYAGQLLVWTRSAA